MKKVLFAAMLAGTAFATPTLAADLARKAPVFVPPPVFSWTGFYAGVNVGYGFDDRSNVTTTGQLAVNVNNVNGGARPANARLNSDGVIGGGQIGYNWQVSPNWLFGIEADFQGTDIRDRRNVVTIPLNGIGTLNNVFQTQLDYFGTVRGRFGYTFDRTLIYATGGFAYGRVQNSANFFGPAGNNQFTGTTSKTETGYTVGGGIEHYFTQNWSVKGEYLYYDLGSTTTNVAVIVQPVGQGGGSGYNSRFNNDGHIVRMGLNYKFSGGVF